MSELDRYVGKDRRALPKPRPDRVGEPDRVVAKLAAGRAAIVGTMKTHGLICSDCAGPDRGELVEPVRVDVFASDMPNAGPNVIALRFVRCEVCQRVWDPMRREWAKMPEPIEDRK